MNKPGASLSLACRFRLRVLSLHRYANKQTAIKLAISQKTVEKHRDHLMKKLGIHNSAGLTRYAIEAGISQLQDQYVL